MVQLNRTFCNRNGLARALPAIAYASLIFWISSLSQPNFPTDLFPLRDKGVHVLEFFVLGFLCTHALPYGCNRTAKVVFGALFSLAYGALDEVHQSLVPGRSAEVADAIADAIGSSLGAIAYAIYFTKSNFRHVNRTETLARRK